MRKIRQGSFIGLFLAVVVSTGGVGDAARAGPTSGTLPMSGPAWKDGAEVYNKVCAYCHEGGPVGPEIRNRELPPAYVNYMVRNGNRAMPAFRAAEIDDESLAKLAEYISKN